MPIYFVVFMVIILPALIVLEGLKMFFSFMTRNNKGWWWNLPYILIVILSLFMVVLLLFGYRY